MVWFAVPLASSKYVLGVTHSYIQWDPNRRWVREKPEWAETLPAGERSGAGPRHFVNRSSVSSWQSRIAPKARGI
jgi:hypothetical protein